MYRLLISLAFFGCIVWLYLEPSPEPVVGILTAFAGFFRDEIHGVIGMKIFSLTPKNKLIRNFEESKYSFTDSEFINPRIVEDLIGWLSDLGGELVSIDIARSNSSNRYFGEVSVEKNKNKYPKVYSNYEGQWFAYQYIGKSFSGMHLLQTWSNGGGSGVFCNIVLVTLSLEKAFEGGPEGSKKIDRFVVKLIGTLPLGDRYEGNVFYKFGFLSISSCKGICALRNRNSIALVF
ncbi:MAG: hypothetical protein EOO53_16150 [Gammaproteobacteria bacterium]|nr:MAG: hypothetical protein EOO53_16150 [Gammaproteobacteria bacterium]